MGKNSDIIDRKLAERFESLVPEKSNIGFWLKRLALVGGLVGFAFGSMGSAWKFAAEPRIETISRDIVVSENLELKRSVIERLVRVEHRLSDQLAEARKNEKEEIKSLRDDIKWLIRNERRK